MIGLAFFIIEYVLHKFSSKIKYLRNHRKYGEEEKHKLLVTVCDLVEQPLRKIAFCLQVVLIILLMFIVSNAK
jgi:hypothetical protein